MPYRAVIFDLFGTLVPVFAPEAFRGSLEAMADAAGLDREGFIRLWVHDTSRARMSGEFVTIEANVEHIARALGASPSAEHVAAAAALRLSFYRASLQPRPDAVPTLRALKARGLRLGLISDCSCEAPQLWPQTPFAELIEAPIFSCRAGATKPDPRLYRLVCEGLGVEPESCLYIGDGAGRELTGARAAGMHAALIAVPGEVGFDQAQKEAATWDGPRVESLSRLLDILSGA